MAAPSYLCEVCKANLYTTPGCNKNNHNYCQECGKYTDGFGIHPSRPIPKRVKKAILSYRGTIREVAI